LNNQNSTPSVSNTSEVRNQEINIGTTGKSVEENSPYSGNLDSSTLLKYENIALKHKLEYFETELSKKIKLLGEISGDLVEKDNLIQQMKGDLVKRDQMLGKRDQMLDQMKGDLVKRDQMLDQMKDELLIRDQILVQIKWQLENKEEMLRRKDRMLLENEEELKCKDMEILSLKFRSCQKEEIDRSTSVPQSNLMIQYFPKSQSDDSSIKSKSIKKPSTKSDY